MYLHQRAYLWYKFLNSLFFGLSVGSVFVLYTPLEPSIYSIGGIFLALGMLLIAKFYDVLMHVRAFYYITLWVEVVVLVFVALFLLFGYSYMIALSIYIGYQITFIFGSYLVRMETKVLGRTALLSFVDIAKQKGYLAGLVISYGFYKLLEYLRVDDKQTQVYDLHVGLLFLEFVIIWLIIKAFVKK